MWISHKEIIILFTLVLWERKEGQPVGGSQVTFTPNAKYDVFKTSLKVRHDRIVKLIFQSSSVFNLF
jgi:hypothetical protein